MPISTPTRSPAIGGESTFTYCGMTSLHGLWVILCYYSLDGSPLRGVAMRPPLGGRTRLVIFKENILNKVKFFIEK